MSTRKSLLAGLPALLVSSLVLCAGASAHVRASASLSLESSQVSAGTAVPFAYSTSHVPRGVRVSLQRQFGSQKVYRDVLTLHRASGNGSAPGLPMGRFGFRLALHKGGKLLASTSPVYVYSYGTVTLAQLCQNTSSDLSIGNCGGGTVQVGNTVFSYHAVDANGNSSGEGTAELTAQHSTCRSGSISYALSNNANPSAEADVQVTQPSADPQTDATPYGTVSTLKFVLGSPAWDVIFWENPAGSSVYWDGSFSCWTATGQ